MAASPQDHGPQHTASPETSAPTGGAGSQRAGEESRAPAPGVFEELSRAFASARAALSNFLDLVTLEVRRAGLTLMWMVVLGIVAGICVVAAWLGLMVALAMTAVEFGVSPIMAAFGVVLVNLVLAGVLVRICIGMSRNLLFAATRRQVAGTLHIASTAS